MRKLEYSSPKMVSMALVNELTAVDMPNGRTQNCCDFVLKAPGYPDACAREARDDALGVRKLHPDLMGYRTNCTSRISIIAGKV
ncbi:hypothetical protein NQ317_015620 [Molorchus minor]|uniref:Uncharacterized protein n=1 Tax=Molorchus minor TaxID=1323400 RepID=A0ABQ9JTQ4_9CUCU|nr:hypothetical protein NQ317_015620 [Molorchus minor]